MYKRRRSYLHALVAMAVAVLVEVVAVAAAVAVVTATAAPPLASPRRRRRHPRNDRHHCHHHHFHRFHGHRHDCTVVFASAFVEMCPGALGVRWCGVMWCTRQICQYFLCYMIKVCFLLDFIAKNIKVCLDFIS